jgi:hypothetical protein
MPPIILFLAVLGAFFDGLGHLIDGLSNAGFFTWLSNIEWPAMLHWFRSSPVAAPQLNSGNEALYSQFQQFMDMQFQIGEAKRYMLTLPASPEVGF